MHDVCQFVSLGLISQRRDQTETRILVELISETFLVSNIKDILFKYEF